LVKKKKFYKIKMQGQKWKKKKKKLVVWT